MAGGDVYLWQRCFNVVYSSYLVTYCCQVELGVQLLLISISTLPERMMRPLLTIPDAAPMFRAA